MTTSGRNSKWLLRASTFSPVAARLRFRAAPRLSDEGSFLELGDRAEHLTHKDRGRSVFHEVPGRRRRDKGDASRLKHVVAREPCHEVAGKSVGTSDNDRPRPVAEKPLEHFRETGMIAAQARAAMGDRMLVSRDIPRAVAPLLPAAYHGAKP